MAWFWQLSLRWGEVLATLKRLFQESCSPRERSGIAVVTLAVQLLSRVWPYLNTSPREEITSRKEAVSEASW